MCGQTILEVTGVVRLATRTKEEWIQRGEQTDDIDECFPGWRDQIEGLSSMDEEQLQAGLENMQLELATIDNDDDDDDDDDGDHDEKYHDYHVPSLTYFIGYTKFCLAQIQTEASEGLAGSTSAACGKKEGVSSQPTKKLKTS
jgi:hypothetical protein